MTVCHLHCAKSEEDNHTQKQGIAPAEYGFTCTSLYDEYEFTCTSLYDKYEFTCTSSYDKYELTYKELDVLTHGQNKSNTLVDTSEMCISTDCISTDCMYTNCINIDCIYADCIIKDCINAKLNMHIVQTQIM